MNAPAPRSSIHISGLSVAYDGRAALHDITGEFAPGSLTAVVGPNGAGKTSLIAAIMGRVRPAAGLVRIGIGPGERMAWLPQQAEIDRTFPITVFDLLALGLWGQLGGFKGIAPAQRHAVAEALETVGLGGFERRSIGALSTGQFQRVLFARVLLQDAAVILLDEPFNAVDARTTSDLLGLIARWHAEARTVVAVLHDLGQARSHFEQALLLARECIAWGKADEVLQEGNLLRARRMAEAWSGDSAARKVAA